MSVARAAGELIGSDVRFEDPLCVLTWNVNQKMQAKSVLAPVDSKVWSGDDNFDAIWLEISGRLKPDVVALQECPEGGSTGFVPDGYEFLGENVGHCGRAGFVRLYAKKAVNARCLNVQGIFGVDAVAKIRGIEI